MTVPRDISSAGFTKPPTKQQPNKFKTGGIVATAAVHPATQRTRRLAKHQHHNNAGHLPAMRHTVTAAAATSNGLSAIADTTDTEPTNVKDFMKKVKIKIKKKKNKQKGAVN